MTSIADSDAFGSAERVLPQHQAAVTLLQARLSAPATTRLRWLDLACGRGQIILSLNDSLSDEARSKIEYLGYDIDQDFARLTRKIAETCGFASHAVTVGHLMEFDRILPDGELFDFVTLTNVVHELEPMRLAELFVNAVMRLTETGTLFVYDMERIKPPELGALPWSREEMRTVIFRMVSALGGGDYHPEVGLWRHRTVDGWNAQLDRQHFGNPRSDALERTSRTVEEVRTVISELLSRKLASCRASLEAFTTYGAQTGEEQEDKERLLYEFWAISRALERSK